MGWLEKTLTMSNYREHNESMFLRNQEMLIDNSVAFTTLNALVLACSEHIIIGEDGKSKDVINQFGEQALRADLAAEKTVIENLSEYFIKNGGVIEINGEETGTSILGNKGNRHFGVLDGLDGSSNYLNPSEWSYGTMLAIAKGESPKYKDFEVAGIGLPQENWVLMAIKGSGVLIYDIDNQTYRKIKPFEVETYDESKILSDNYFPEAKKMLGKMDEIWLRTGSTAASIVAMTIGDEIIDPKYKKMNQKWQGLADVTRKGNLEQPALYLILSELGGVMVDKNGKDIGDNSFKDWGQREKVPLISAKSKEIAENILSRLTRD